MNKPLLIIASLLLVNTYAQVGINTNNPQGSLDVSYEKDWGNTKLQGIVNTRMNTFQRDQMTHPVEGLMIYNTTNHRIEIYNGTYWVGMSSENKEASKLTGVTCTNGETPVLDKNYGDGTHDFVYCPVNVSVGNYTATWLNYNLGAAYTKVGSKNFDVNKNKTGTSAHADEKLYGSTFQWQRPADGHELRVTDIYNSTTTFFAISWTDMGRAEGKFILPQSGFNWYKEGVYDTSGANVALWQVGGVNNPCPEGYHVPTNEEWQAFDTAIKGAGDNVWTQTVLPNLAAAGNRLYGGNGDYNGKGEYGYYYSSNTYGGEKAYAFFFNPSSSIPNYNYDVRANGASIRCIKN